MKITIITIHGIPNFGSVFQSYALCKFLNNNGYDNVEVIDYNPSYYEPSSLRAIVGRILNYKHFKVRKNKFRNFIETNLNLTKSYTTLSQLENDNWNSDVYVAGGDQLWNIYHPCGNDDAYKLTFVKGKKISYATSMGQKGFSDENLKNLAQKIADFSSVSVRESSSVELLSKVDINATHCVDPVFLLDSKEYDKFIKPINEPKYMMVYLVKSSPLLDKVINYLSNKYNLKVYLCSGFSKKCACDKVLKDLGPDEILSYIKNAEIVLSSSFHATSFSLIFKKQFYTILPGASTNERIIDLLTIRGLTNRIVTDDTNFEVAFNSEIDYENVKTYDELINASKDYLLKALK